MKSIAGLFRAMFGSGRLLAGYRSVVCTLMFLISQVVMVFPSAASADETAQEPLKDRLTIRGGWAYVFGDDTTITIPGPGGVGVFGGG